MRARRVVLMVLLAAALSHAAFAAALTPEMLQRGQEAVARLNLYRRQMDLPEVVLDEQLSEGCALHAAYLNLNVDQINQGLDAHHEYADRPGYSDAGKDAGLNSDISYGYNGADAVTVWFNIYYHRSPMLSQGLTKVGYGDDPGNATGYSIALLRFFIYSEIAERLTPAPNSAGNPTHPDTGETPPPVPNFGASNGIPIIAYFSSSDVDKVQWVSSTVNANGRELSHAVIAPNRPVNPEYENNEIVLITDFVFPINATISVSIQYTQGSATLMTKDWSFTTSADGRFDPVAAATGGSGGASGGVDDLTDSDGDGFPDLIELAAGTSPGNSASTPFGGTPAPGWQALSLSKMSIKLNFAAPNDSVIFSGTLPLPDGFTLAGQKVIVNVGGVVKAFSFDARGRPLPALNSKFTLAKSKDGFAKFSVRLLKGNFGPAFLDENLSGAGEVVKQPRSVRVTIYLNDMVLSSTQPLEYSAKAMKSGSAKQM